MKWEEVRKIYADKWILFEAIEAHSKNGKRIIDDISIINSYEEGKEALKEYVDSIEIGELKLKNLKVEIGVMDYGFDINGIVGMEFLKKVGAIISLNEMTIDKAN